MDERVIKTADTLLEASKEIAGSLRGAADHDPKVTGRLLEVSRRCGELIGALPGKARSIGRQDFVSAIDAAGETIVRYTTVERAKGLVTGKGLEGENLANLFIEAMRIRLERIWPEQAV
ncbi:MAG: hypothetical protein US89_C0006G0066 [Candidatus Peregrinibacteria bacterium GW2011_GWF2_38_29]|nr:MAG: hypothetical protein US89_C0006G0066 [Candidatus Peregrinibacteria bacterium GW2011_GWF2_38_29]HBB03257.1 hypothetical protein [Candidatus Peregrinibacteria bacterium]